MVKLLSNDYKRLLDKKHFKPRLTATFPPPNKIILEREKYLYQATQKKNKREIEKKNDACIIAEGITTRSPEQGCGISSLFVYLFLSHIEINVCPKFVTTGTD